MPPSSPPPDRSPGDGVSVVPGGHQAPPGAPPLPGGTAVSLLRVYTSSASDGLAGGTPHLHTACTEAYVVTRGQGRVLTVDGAGAHSTPLAPGAMVWFTPGTVHRLVNDSGDLELVVIMGNAGLPEAGDMVITFPDEVLADREHYREAATLPAGSTTTDGTGGASGDAAVRARRDLAVEGWAALVGADGVAARARLHARAAALVAPEVEAWRRRWAAGPLAAVEATRAHLDALSRASGDHLGEARTVAVPPPPAERRHGCCGTLGVVLTH